MTEQSAVIIASLIGLGGTMIGVIITLAVQCFITRTERISQFRLAALEKRLAVHQDAYELWINLFWNIHDPEKVPGMIIKCQEWWTKNCLYLDPKTRWAFKTALHHAGDFNKITRDQAQLKKDTFNDIKKVGELIVAGVDLPVIGEYENKKISQP